MEHFPLLRQPTAFGLLKQAVFPAAVCLVQSAFAQGNETEGVASNPANNVYEAINDCYQKVPLETLGESTVHIMLAIDGSGALAREPLATELSYSAHERRLFRKAMLAIVRCTPFQVGNLAPTGKFVLSASQDEITVDALHASLQSAKEMITLPDDYLNPAKERLPAEPTVTKEIEEALDLSRDDRREIQHRLKLVDHDPGGADGVFGPKTRAAISDWQNSQGLSQSGYLSENHVDVLKNQSEVRYQEFQKSRPKKKSRRVRVCKRGVLGVLYDCRYVWR